MPISEQKEKKRPRLTELFAFVGVLVSIMIAGTTLWNYSGNVPLWWFQSSFIFLVLLTFFTIGMFFHKPLSERMWKFRLQRKRDKIAKRYFSDFRNLVNASKRFNDSIRQIFDNLRTHYSNAIKSRLASYVLQSHNESEINNSFYYIESALNESNKTFRDLSLIMRHFEFVLDTYKRNLKIIEAFAHEMMSLNDKPIAKGIEANFEDFREKYNYFLKDFKDYCIKVNQEIGERVFHEWAFDYVKKW